LGWLASAIASGLRDGILAQMLGEQDAAPALTREFDTSAGECAGQARRYGVIAPRRASARPRRSRFIALAGACRRVCPGVQSWLAPPRSILPTTGKFITIRAITGTRQYVVSSRKFTVSHRCNERWFRPSPRYLGKSRPQPGDRALPQHSAASTSTCIGPCAAALAVALNRTGQPTWLRLPVKVYPSGLSGTAPDGRVRTGAWSLRKEADYFREVFGRELFCTLA